MQEAIMLHLQDTISQVDLVGNRSMLRLLRDRTIKAVS